MKQKPPSPLRNMRRTRTIGQAALAHLVGVSQGTISKAERGVLLPSLDVQARIAAILGASREDLFPPITRSAAASRDRRAGVGPRRSVRAATPESERRTA